MAVAIDIMDGLVLGNKAHHECLTNETKGDAILFNCFIRRHCKACILRHSYLALYRSLSLVHTKPLRYHHL